MVAAQTIRHAAAQVMQLRRPAGPGAIPGPSRFFLDQLYNDRDHAERVRPFLDLIREREAALMARLFDAPFVTCETELRHTLGQAR